MTVKTDTITEYSSAAGVTIDGVLLKDGAVAISGAVSLPVTTASVGLISQDGARLLHTYKDPTADGLNTFLGFQAGNFTLSPAGGASSLASSNTGIGYQALKSLTTGHLNAAVGDLALALATSAVSCTAVGHSALANNSTGGNNTAVGGGALQENTTGSKNNAFGIDTMVYNTTGEYNIAIGCSALRLNTTASHNIAIGDQALYANTTGTQNVALGNAVLTANTTGAANVGVGHYALSLASSGAHNTGVGANALQNTTTGHSNSTLGYGSLNANTTGASNVAIGFNALVQNQTGYENVAIGKLSGYNAGTPLTALYGCTLLGDLANLSTNALSNVIVIGSGAQGTKSNQVVLGNANIVETLLRGKVGIGTIAPGTKLEVVDPAYTVDPTLKVKATESGSFAIIGIDRITNDRSALTAYSTAGVVDWYTGTVYGAGGVQTRYAISTSYNLSDAKIAVQADGLVGIGTTAPATLLHAVSTTATTNAIRNVLTLGANVTDAGYGAAGLGAAVLFQAESTTTADTTQARIAALWYEATHATFKGDLVGYASDAGGEREGWRVRANGSAPAIGFLGAAPIARIAHVADPAGGATVDAEARSAINSILATLENFGFHATS